MQVLTVLAEHAGHVVSKERLLQTVWADTFVGDEALSKAISELRRCLGDDPKAPRFIQTIPKGGYRLVSAVTRGQSPHDEPGPSPASAIDLIPAAPVSLRPRWFRRSIRRLFIVSAVSLGLATTATVVWLLRHSREPAPAPMQTVRLTTLPGIAESPTFSPDGRQVAFSWNGKTQDNFDIYVTLVGSSEVRRLTNDPLTDTLPRWSPDGRSIAFLRDRPDGTTIQLLSSLGGTDHRVSDFRGADSLSWSPDSRWLAAGRWGRTDDRVSSPDERGIYLIPVEGGEPRRLIPANAQTFIPGSAFSSDGRRLAYASCRGRVYRRV
jgi:Tol biopolymer transport system component